MTKRQMNQPSPYSPQGQRHAIVRHPPSFALEVNEAAIWATRRGADWWNEWRLHQERTGRITIVAASLGGDRVRVACDSRSDAVWLRGHMTGFGGIPASAVKIVTERRLP